MMLVQFLDARGNTGRPWAWNTECLLAASVVMEAGGGGGGGAGSLQPASSLKQFLFNSVTKITMGCLSVESPCRLLPNKLVGKCGARRDPPEN